jgi:23S rRNA (uracil1939-C5)-methyltransferase
MNLCSHFSVCGGCTTQNQSYAQQLIDKEALIQKCFQGIEACFLPIIPSPLLLEYRNKMEFSFSQNKKGEHFLGLMMSKGRGRVINLSQCLLTTPWFIQTLHSVREWWKKTGLEAYYPPKDRGILRTLTLREGKRTKEKMVLITIAGREGHAISQPDLDALVDALLKTCPIDSIILRVQWTAKKTPTRFEESILYGKDTIQEILWYPNGSLFFKIRPSSFFQPNPYQAEQIYRRAIEMADLDAHETVYDLYCGSGALGMFAAAHASQVIGVELNSDAVKDARENLEQNGIANMKILEKDVGELSLTGQRSVVFVDPPRMGLSSKAVTVLSKLQPKKIIYISCNPVTQALNVRELLQFGYQVKLVQPIDQFPQTPHVENIVSLSLSKFS